MCYCNVNIFFNIISMKTVHAHSKQKVSIELENPYTQGLHKWARGGGAILPNHFLSQKDTPSFPLW